MSVQIGVIYPQTELPTDVRTVRAYVSKVEELGYRHFEIYDHVLGADPAAHTGWKGPYDVDTTFHEPFVFYGFLAGITQLELVTGIIVAPQRQTALLAKQAAEVDILSEGRFRLGLGAGWKNPVEYEALGQDFSTRAAGWRSRSGCFGACGRNGRSRTRERSTGSWEPGWLRCRRSGPSRSGSEACRRLPTGGWDGSPIIAAAAAEAGRDPTAIGMDARIKQGPGGTDDLVRGFERWRDAGATHVSVDTMGSGLPGLDGHLDALTKAAEALQLADAAERRA